MSQKNKRRGKNTKSKIEGQKRDMIFAEDEQMYATVEKMLGNCRAQAKCSDGKSRICHIRGKMKKRVWIREGSSVLIGMRDFEDDKADIIHCYTPDEVRKLKSYGEIVNDENMQDINGNTDDNIMWEGEEDNKIAQNKPEQKSNSKLDRTYEEIDKQQSEKSSNETNIDNEIDFL